MNDIEILDQQRKETEFSIINEKPYNWFKHFLFDLPEIVFETLKFGAYILIFLLISQALMNVMIQELPTFCEALK